MTVSGQSGRYREINHGDPKDFLHSRPSIFYQMTVQFDSSLNIFMQMTIRLAKDRRTFVQPSILRMVYFHLFGPSTLARL